MRRGCLRLIIISIVPTRQASILLKLYYSWYDPTSLKLTPAPIWNKAMPSCSPIGDPTASIQSSACLLPERDVSTSITRNSLGKTSDSRREYPQRIDPGTCSAGSMAAFRSPCPGFQERHRRSRPERGFVLLRRRCTFSIVRCQPGTRDPMGMNYQTQHQPSKEAATGFSRTRHGGSIQCEAKRTHDSIWRSMFGWMRHSVTGISVWVGGRAATVVVILTAVEDQGTLPLLGLEPAVVYLTTLSAVTASPRKRI